MVGCLPRVCRIPGSIPYAESKQAKTDDAVLGTGVRYVLKFLSEDF